MPKALHKTGRLFPVLLSLMLAEPLAADTADPLLASLDDDLLGELSLEELLQIEVTTVSQRKEPLSSAPSAVYVLTGEEIRRSGATNIPEALRLVPGLQVARIDPHSWAISARGNNGTLADKLEVLMDGRSLYTPLFSGVFWEIQDTLLEDVERIEVIRGPGATLWGANAVNGVINIITKSAQDTQGRFLQVGGGNDHRLVAGWRESGRLGNTGRVRAWLRQTVHDDARLSEASAAPGRPVDNGIQLFNGGMRADWGGDDARKSTLIGNFYNGTLGGASADEELRGGSALYRTGREGLDSAWSLQAYYDRSDRRQPGLIVEQRNTYDATLKGRKRLGQRHELNAGLGYRRSDDDIEDSVVLAFNPPSRTLETWSLYLQDRITLLPERLHFTLGSKFEHNDFTGSEVQPSARLAWLPSSEQTLWTAVSRAVRTPNRLDHDVTFFTAGPGGTRIPQVISNDGFASEELIAYELGYRWRPRSTVLLEAATYYNDYDELRGIDASQFPLSFANVATGIGMGAELTARWQPQRHLQFDLGYAYLRQKLRLKPGQASSGQLITSPGDDPRHQASLRVTMQPRNFWTAHAFLRYVSALPNQNVEGYTELDLAFHRQVGSAATLSLAGQNLLDSAHAEFGGASSAEVPRAFYAALSWRYE